MKTTQALKLSALSAALAFSISAHATSPITVYTAKDIITVSDTVENADTVAVLDGKIVAVGMKDDVLSSFEEGTNLVMDDSFNDKVITPGFIDPHAHMWLFGAISNTHFITPADWQLPWGDVKGVQGQEAYFERLIELDKSLPEGEPLVTWGYHSYFHGELNKEILDKVSKTRPIVVWQRSVHEIYFNSAALDMFGITKEDWSTDAVGMEYVDWDKGYVYEKGLYIGGPYLFSLIATPEKFADGIERAHNYLQAGGVTGVTDPGVLIPPPMQKAMIDIMESGVPMMDYQMIVAGNVIYDNNGNDAQGGFETAQQIIANPELNSDYVRYLPNYVKLFTDGAAYAQLFQLKDGYIDGHDGEWIQYPHELEDSIAPYWMNDWTSIIHANGDLGLETGINIIEELNKKKPREDHRTSFQHLAVTDPVDIKRGVELGANFSTNPFYLHVLGENYGQFGVGEERAYTMARGRSFIDAGARLSFHSDAPMAPGRPLALSWTAVNRTGLSGKLMGEEEKLTMEEAMRAITIDAAYVTRNENEVGSIDVGKYANFAILEDHPYEVASQDIKDINVWGTVFHGNVIKTPEAAEGMVMNQDTQNTMNIITRLDSMSGRGDSCDSSMMYLEILNEGIDYSTN